MSPAIPSVPMSNASSDHRRSPGRRTRVHNINISLDGYAAGEHVTFDSPIGGAERLFKWFDGRVIHCDDKSDAPVTLDRALTSMWSQDIATDISDAATEPQRGRPDDGWRGWWATNAIPDAIVRHDPPPAPHD